MVAPRIIPTLLYQDGGLVKTQRFRNPVYVGDPVNTARIFNDSGADELLLLDIQATIRNESPNLSLISDVAAECFMPLAYGGGITSYKQAESILRAGVEKVVINTAALRTPGLLTECAERFGSQAVIASIDYRLASNGARRVYTHGGQHPSPIDPMTAALEAEHRGAGEILLACIDRDGMRNGYDIELVRAVSGVTGVPVIASGGAGELGHLRQVVQEGKAAAGAAGALFVFYGRYQAVLINYPERAEATELFQ